MENTHLIDLDILSGEEYLCGGEDLFNESFFIDYAQTGGFEKLYHQYEFRDEFGTSMCTMYGPMTTLSIMLGRELTKEERRTMVVDRYNRPDFDPKKGGLTRVGVDVVRKYFPEFSTALVDSDDLRRKIIQKNIPVVTSMRGNLEYSKDSRDGTIDLLDYGRTTYGHCRTMRGLRILDNYEREYRYKSLDDFEHVRKTGVESPNCYVIFKEDNLSPKGKLYLRGMKDKRWNGSNPDRNATRYECALMTKGKWNKKNPDQEVSIYEASVMIKSVKPEFPEYLGTDRNKPITRGKIIEMIYA